MLLIITKKFLISSKSMVHMNFMDKTKVLEFDDIHVFLNTWIKRRLEIY